jgi:hypothetical protein
VKYKLITPFIHYDDIDSLDEAVSIKAGAKSGHIKSP